MTTPLRINMWSGPRNLSTALMYSWRQRPDTTVVDEPLYGHYLRVTNRTHPGAAEVMASMSTDGDQVVTDVILGSYESEVVLFKQMAKHLVGLDRGFLSATENILLVRDPLEMLTSFQKNVPDTTVDDTGFVELVEIMEWLLSQSREPVVVDSTVLLRDPPGVLGELCDRLGLAFDPAMLAWSAGPKPEDGVWAPHWYEAVHASTGFAAHRPKGEALLPHLEPVLERTETLYRRLAPYRLR